MNETIYQVHWLSVTIHADMNQSFLIYDLLFQEKFGSLEELPHGGKSFRKIYSGLLGFKIYTTPVNSKYEYFHYEIPGQACELIDWAYFKAFWDLLCANYAGTINVTRLDIAFDQKFFTPQNKLK